MKPLPAPRPAAEQESLDPADWDELRRQGHRMLDDMLDYLEHIRDRPVWQPIPPEVRGSFSEPLPREPADLAGVHQTFMRNILPYTVGNAHPGFMGWVHGAGTPVGMLAEMLAAGLNANLGGRDHIPIEVERQITRWMRELFGFPDTASGLFVTGTSMANIIGVLVARTPGARAEVRQHRTGGRRCRVSSAYTSAGAHGCVAQAMDLGGIGTRRPAPDRRRRPPRIDLAALARPSPRTARPAARRFCSSPRPARSMPARSTIWRPWPTRAARGPLVPCRWRLRRAGDAGAGPGAAPGRHRMRRFHRLRFPQMGAGALRRRFHPGARRRRSWPTFAAPAGYLRRDTRGMSAGSPWPCDLGPDLSRGFRALKTWFTFKVHGGAKIGRTISRTCVLARYLQSRIEAEPRLELLAPAALNIVCFRYRCADADRVNSRLIIAPAGVRHRRAVLDLRGRTAGHPRGHRQPPHPRKRPRCPARSDLAPGRRRCRAMIPIAQLDRPMATLNQRPAPRRAGAPCCAT